MLLSNAAQLLVFVRYNFDRKLYKNMPFCTALAGTCTDSFTKSVTTIRGTVFG